MDLWQLLVYGLIGFVGGTLSGLIGIGGGAVFVPALVYAAGWGIKDATAASLFTFVFGALSGTLRSLRSENSVNWKAVALLTSVVAPSALVGVVINRFSPELLVQLAFAAFLIILAYPVAYARPPTAERSRRIPRALVLFAGVGVGIMAGLVGIGGTVLMIPLMVLGLGLRFEPAAADRGGNARGLAGGQLQGAYPGDRTTARLRPLYGPRGGPDRRRCRKRIVRLHARELDS